MARAIERGIRKAALPVAYSSGFSPHPKVSYAGGAPTGAASEAEYLELALTEPRVPADVQERLDAALPDGIDVIEVTEVRAGQDRPRLEASQWQVVLPGVTRAVAEAAVTAFLAAPAIQVERLTGKGIRRLDARAAVVTMQLGRRADDDRHAGSAILRMVVRQMTPAVRPDDILAALRTTSAALAPSSPPLVTRLTQGPLAAVADAAGAGLTGISGAADRQEKAARLAAGVADAACPAPPSAYEQFPRGAEGSAQDLSAREPDGRVSPDARDRAAQRRTTI